MVEVFLGVIIIGLLGMVFCSFMLFRNSWVYEERDRVLDDIPHNNWDWSEWNSLWSYDKMLWHFWIWDIEKMKSK